MSSTTYYLPIDPTHAADAHLTGWLAREHAQEPKTTTDTPAGAANPGASSSGGSNPGASGAAPGTPGSLSDPNTPTPGANQSPCGSEGMLWMMPVFLVLMYFMMIRPEQKRKKEQVALLSSIRQGDRVVTVHGMHGVISRLTEKTVTLRLDSGEATFDRSAVGRIERSETDKPATS